MARPAVAKRYPTLTTLLTVPQLRNDLIRELKSLAYSFVPVSTAVKQEAAGFVEVAFEIREE